MHALIILIVCIITVSCTFGYIVFSKTNKSENNIFIGLSNTNRYYVSKNFHDATKVATFKGEHKIY